MPILPLRTASSKRKRPSLPSFCVLTVKPARQRFLSNVGITNRRKTVCFRLMNDYAKRKKKKLLEKKTSSSNFLKLLVFKPVN